jgi:translation initiation factor IF-3
MKRPRINLQIQANEVRVVDEDGRDLGVFAIADALKLVASRREDVVEIEPDAVPPLCQCIGYGKFRYRQLQDEKKRRGL